MCRSEGQLQSSGVDGSEKFRDFLDRLMEDVARLRQQTEAAVAADDPLNVYRVVADFCLPTYCCDSDCADFEFAQPQAEEERPAPAPTQKKITLRGSIVAARGTNTLKLRAGNAKPLVNAVLDVFDRDNASIKVKMVRGSFTFTVAPGEYLLRASAPRFRSREEQQKIVAPLNRDAVIALEPAPKAKGAATRTLRADE